MMSRKHYVAVAEILSAELATNEDETTVRALLNVTRSVADVFKRDNRAFDRQRFYDAVTDGTSAGRIIA